MKTISPAKETTSTKFKRGSIGYAIQQLVKKHGQGSNGFYILESALKEVCGMPSFSQVTVGGLPIDETPRVKEIKAIEKEIIDSLREAETAREAREANLNPVIAEANISHVKHYSR